jgi:SAM-dependent methyltransferase
MEDFVLSEHPDRWAAGDAYEAFMGRWSRLLAIEFLKWLAPTPHANWLEVGCGTGALTQAICQRAAPASLLACDPTAEFVSFARRSTRKCPAEFLLAGSDTLPRRDGGFDVIVSGLVLNFLPHPLEAVRSMRERLRPRGTLAAYVWDYAEGMQFLRIFWDEAVALDQSASPLDEALRFPHCRPDALLHLFNQAGIDSLDAGPLQIATDFPDFDAFWTPFLGGTGPAPSYVASLDPGARQRLRMRLEKRLVRSSGGPIRLEARAFAVRGCSPLQPAERVV